jgi:hypothetical protein
VAAALPAPCSTAYRSPAVAPLVAVSPAASKRRQATPVVEGQGRAATMNKTSGRHGGGRGSKRRTRRAIRSQSWRVEEAALPRRVHLVLYTSSGMCTPWTRTCTPTHPCSPMTASRYRLRSTRVAVVRAVVAAGTRRRRRGSGSRLGRAGRRCALAGGGGALVLRIAM